ncbi:discoidin domain-containing protein [Kribbella sp. NBC_01245]|uniref:glycoside hydrolase domain-containing protein n=1 Tax=Kribbella sp. NBC_01245 TaxID=2903578 RepID=UPI002E28A3C0|nr:glycoside hydrolase domain-containing protein [Kribbella sp. NBC_01245]
MSSLRTARAVGIGVLVALTGTLLTPPATAAPPAVWVHNAADHVFSSTPRPANAPTTITLHAARGEVEAAQIMLRPDQNVTGAQLAQPAALTGPGGATIPVTSVTLRSQYNHPNILIGGEGAELGPMPDIDRAPNGQNDYYDALVENTPKSVPAGYTQAFHYSVSVPAGQAPGAYTGSVTVRSSGGDTVVPVTVVVYPVDVPPANQSTFKMNGWTTSVGWDYSGTERAIPFQYDNAAAFSPNWWKVIESFARNQAKHRNNLVYADFQALIRPRTQIDAQGNYLIDWTDFDRFVQLFVDAGAMQYIYTPTLLEPGPNGAEDPHLEMLKNVNGQVQRVLVPPNTTESTSYLKMMFAKLREHLVAKGWAENFYMSALDEPTHPNQATAAAWFYDLYDDYFPNPRTNEAYGFSFLPEAAQRVSTVTPYTENYEDHAGFWQAQKRAGKDLWLYTCIVPQNFHMNRLIGMHLAKTRLLPWLVWKIGGTGYLHWGWNYWHRWTNDNARQYNTFDEPQTGDTFIVRPNRAALDVYDSVRSETQLDGQEDFELLTKLAAVKPNLARAIVESLITDFSSYERSGASVYEKHRQILAALVSPAPDIRTDGPLTDDFAAGTDNLRFAVDDGNGQPTGHWRTESGELVQSRLEEGWYSAAAAIEGRSYGDLVADADLRITGVAGNGGQNNWAGLVVRNVNATDYNTGYLAAIRNNGEVFLHRGDQEIGKAQIPGYQPGQWTHLRVIAKGKQIRVYVGANAAPLLTVTDDAYAVGHVALVTGGTAARFDNLRVHPFTNPAVGAAIQTSSSYDSDGWNSRFAVDGFTGAVAGALGWSSNSQIDVDHTETLTVDLGSAVQAGRVDLWPRADGANVGIGFPVDYTVEISADGSAWTTVASRQGVPRPAAGAQGAAFAERPVRFVRVTGTKLSKDPFGHYRMQFGEVEVAGGNYAAGRAVTASSSSEFHDNGWRRSALTDGLTHSVLGYSLGWTSEPFTTGQQSATVDLGAVTGIKEVALFARSDGANTGAGFPVDFEIQTSLNGSTWTPVVTKTGYPKPDELAQSFTFTATSARYVRVVATKVQPAPGGELRVQLAELEAR